jgi:hypothetical protein
MAMGCRQVAAEFRIPDWMWDREELFLPKFRRTRRAGVLDWVGGRCLTAPSTSCERVVSGKQCLLSLVPAAQCIDTSRCS